MKNTNEVIEAVINGTDVTDIELRYAVRNLSIWQNSLMFPLASGINENPISAKTKRDFQRAWDAAQNGNETPLDKRLKGSSFEPGISREESRERFASSTADTAIALKNALTS